MYLCINDSGTETIVSDDNWKEHYKWAKEIYLPCGPVFILYGSIFFYYIGTPFGYGGDDPEDWIKTQRYGPYNSSHISQIKNTRLEYEVYGYGNVHIVRLGNIKFTYRQTYPGNNNAQILDSVDGMKIEYGNNGYITKVGRYTI